MTDTLIATCQCGQPISMVIDGAALCHEHAMDALRAYYGTSREAERSDAGGK